MLGEIALAIDMGADAVDMGNTIHPPPTLGESMGMAAKVALGSCMDLPPVKGYGAVPAGTGRAPLRRSL
jgi:dihydrolipoamide dehydrogenase